MKNNSTTSFIKRAMAWILIFMTAFLPLGNYANAALTVLADEPASAGAYIPPNVMMNLSVEWPTGVVAAYNDNAGTLDYVDSSGVAQTKSCPGRQSLSGVAHGLCYFKEVTYIGYFDPYKCYDYNAAIVSSTVDGTTGAFVPGAATDSLHQCSGRWSGNYLNWAATQAIDGFRLVMTGGNRSVDTTSTTILEKAAHTGQGGNDQFPVKRVGGSSFTNGGVTVTPVDRSTVTPFASSSNSPLYLRVVTSSSTQVGDGFQMQVSSSSTFSSGNTSYYVRVKVCDSSAPTGYGATNGLESNCTQFGSNYKPTGIIQDKNQAMRFGIFAYLLDSSQSRAGGVMRARMKDTGPNKYIPGTGVVTNSVAEWSAADGVLITNPSPSDATASGVSNSGVVNYLNKFGRANGYKQYDTVSEMYYESLNYLRKRNPTPEYSSSATSAMKDNFPVITNWDDPVQYSCQQNFIITIGDSNTWCDSLVPGNSFGGSACGGHTGTPSTSDTINVKNFTNTVGSLEGMGSLGTTFLSSGRLDTYFISGLAYWSHTQDIRSDYAGKAGARVQQSYFIDVLETGSASGKNQYWLGAKYGSFKDINNDGVPANNATWDSTGDGTPDNYFGANRPDLVSKSLNKVFASITALSAAGAGTGISSPNFDSSSSSGNSSYQTSYKTGEWSGDVTGGTLVVTDTPKFNSTFTTIWNAQPLLDTLASGTGWDVNRKIVTMSNGSAVPFRLANLTSTQQSALGATSVVQQNMLNYLRGSQANEGSLFRVRNHILGDIVNSKAVVISVPNAGYQEASNPGYATFKSNNASRKNMVYAAANDGMVHAINGVTNLTSDPNGGKEVWAYVPSFVITGPSGTPSVDGMAALASLAKPYVHHFYINQTPESRDVDLANTDGSSTTSPTWRTILVGGLGKGGRGYYALDVTDGITAASETAVASKVLWEFTDPDMGFSYGNPVIVKTAKYGWVVLLTSGYNNVSGSNPGKGFLYVVNAKTGALIKKIGTGAGDATTPSGLGRGTAYIPNFDDFAADQFYVGDLLGNMWRFDLRAADGNYLAPVKIASLTDAAGVAQPISVAPQIEISRNNVDRWVFIGTGKDLSSSDAATSQQQTMYAIRDGSKEEPSAATTALNRADFTVVTDLIAGIASPPKGWLYDLTGGSSGTGRERITIDIQANAGVVNFNGNTSSNDPCTVNGIGRTYVVDFDTARSVLSDGTGGHKNFIEGAAVVGANLISVNRKLSILITDASGKTTVPPDPVEQPSGVGNGTVNWREILE